MPIRADKRSGIAMQPQYVTIHNTGNEGKGAMHMYMHIIRFMIIERIFHGILR